MIFCILTIFAQNSRRKIVVANTTTRSTNKFMNGLKIFFEMFNIFRYKIIYCRLTSPNTK